MAHHEHELDPADTRRLEDRARPIYNAGLVAGVVGLFVALAAATFWGGGIQRFGFAYLTSFAFVLSIALGSLFFVLITHLFRAGWSVVVRRPAEVYAATMPWVAVMFVPILLFVVANNGLVYKWAQPIDKMEHHEGEGHGEAGEHAGTGENDYAIVLATNEAHAAPEAGHAAHGDHGGDHAGFGERVAVEHGEVGYIEAKRAYLNIGFWVLRFVVYFGVWIALGLWYLHTSTRQDATADPTLTNKMEGFAPLAVLLFAFTLTFGAFDLLMSLDPVWYSTIFGVYFFAGAFGGAIATLILTTMFLQNRGFLNAVNKEHFHDLGKLQFAFVFFWGYIAFSQFMLIWYANLPETTYWYAYRGVSTYPGAANGWTWVTLALLFFNLLIPFAGLLSRHVKRNRKALAFWAIWLLVMHWVDLWWLVMPQLSERVTFGLVEIGCLVGLVGLFLAGAVRVAAKHSLVPVGDPRLGASLGHENI